MDKIKPEACKNPDHDEMPKNLICIQKECKAHQKVGCQYCFETNENENQKEDHSSHNFVTLKKFQEKLQTCNAIDILQVVREIGEQVSEEQMFEKIDEVVNAIQEKFIITCKNLRKQMRLFIEEVYRDCKINQNQQTLIRNQSEKQKKQPKNFAEMMKSNEQLEKYVGVYQKLAEGKDIKQIKTEQDNEEEAQIDLEKQINDKINSIQKALQDVATQKIEPVIEQMKNTVDQFLNNQKNQITNVQIKTIEQIKQEQEEQKIQQQKQQQLQQQNAYLGPPQKIEVNRIGQSNVSSYEWTKICNDVKKANNLQTLSLNFGFNQNFSDESLKELASSLKQQQNLQTLSLNFFHNQNFSDESLKELASSLKQQQNLQTLSLNFNCNQNFSDESLKELSATLKQMKELKEFNGFFRGCPYGGYDLQGFIQRYRK